MEQKYDSTENTKKHIRRVQELLLDVQLNLSRRAAVHDQSKLESPEKEAADFIDPELFKLKYGTPEYEKCLSQVSEIRKLHFSKNRHHMEAHINGTKDMSLLDLIEFLADGRAASERPTGTTPKDGLEYNIKKYNISDELAAIFRNTQREMCW